MGSVCSGGVAGKNKNEELERKNLGSEGKPKKLKNFEKQKEESYLNSRTTARAKKQNNSYSGFSSELKKSNPSSTGGKQFPRRGSFAGRAGGKVVEVLDTLGSSMPKLNNSNVFGSSTAPRGNKISILAFEVANTINKGVILFQSLSEENIQLLKKEIIESEGVQKIVSNDTKELISLIEADKREEFNIFSKEVARFGNICKDPQWHNLDRYFSGLDLDVLGNKQSRVEAEKTMQVLTALAQNTGELYHELNAFERFEQDYQQKFKEMESLNLPLNGESIMAFQSELKHQGKLVSSLKKKSLWSRTLEQIVEKLVEIATHTHEAISEFLGNHSATVVKYSKGSQRLGEAGLALHYANIINQINMIASRPAALPPNMRDTLYHGLPNNIKNALPSRLQNVDATKGLSITQVKAEMDKTLQWLTPFATNTTKAHQGFGWVGEWANTSNDFGDNTVKENNLIRLQTLYYADKQKMDFYILELLTWLNHLISFVRYRHNATKPMPTRSSTKGLDFQSKMLKFLSLDNFNKPLGTQLSQEDRTLLEQVTKRRSTPGVSKSEDLEVVTKNREACRVLVSSKSVGSTPTRQGLEHRNSKVLDSMDGL
ncbi:protein PSK SIMULATOR 2-like [Gastrolobium bilobum]|uniref:protein PSK SIMULATOR 2-like n=1 Tax=Gastrolobium bilobum TaxID=150636 RepID=UPI002AB15466|nr:protein PSK SIMULATOR 2-like [Gastrolobium bilobum]